MGNLILIRRICPPRRPFSSRKSAQTDPLPDFVEWIQSDCPTGKSVRVLPACVSSPIFKNISVPA
jgi:hypothetical protein